MQHPPVWVLLYMAAKRKSHRFATLYQLAVEAFHPYKWQILALTVLGFGGGLLEGIGVNALIPLFSFALGEDGYAGDFISRTIAQTFSFFNWSYTLEYLLVLVSVLFLGKAVVTVVLHYLRIKITSDYEEATRRRLFKAMLQADWPFLIQQRLGNLETIVMVDVPASMQLLNQISTAIMTATSLLIYIVVALNISPAITLLTLAVGCILFVLFRPLVRMTKKIAYQRTATNKLVAHHVSENILGVKTVKAMSVVDPVAQEGNRHFAMLKWLSIRLAMYKSIIISVVQPVGVVFVCVIFYFFNRLPNFNLAVLIALVYLIQKMFVYIQQLQSTFQAFNEYVPHLRSALDYQKIAEKNREAISQDGKPFYFQQQLEFQGVSFAYTPERSVLRDLSFSVRKGSMVGLVGPSGAGKTTLVDLILRLLQPTTGKIILDGNPILDIKLAEWRTHIGYVSQDIFLVNDTVAQNIRFYDTTISDQAVVEAARMANILDFIQQLPQGFATPIGERGILLSAGQRQRIVIARILARQPELLILDEATSALDNESEFRIQEVIQNLHGKITVIVIAHRLSTVLGVDHLLVLDKGGIVEQGAPQDLLKNKNSYFFKIYNIRNE